MAGTGMGTGSAAVSTKGPTFSFITNQLAYCKENSSDDQYADYDSSGMFCNKLHSGSSPFLLSHSVLP